MKNLVIIPLVLGGFIVAGCATPPPEVTASVPLLSQQVSFDAHYVSVDASSRLESAATGTLISLTSGQIEVLHGYVSALGLPCRQVMYSPSGTKPYKTAACKNKSGWFITPSLMPIEPSALQAQ